MTEIIPYTSEHAAVFKTLNLEWLDKYGLTESHDLLYLDNPQTMILDKGGEIYLAEDGNEIVGTAAIANEGDGVFELIKMSVTAAWQGRGISKMLIERCIERAKAIGAKKLMLFSSSKLTTAVALYEKYGFKHLPPDDAPYQTADIKMEKIL
jgi:putative acetyltransferase